ncbi:hypothetical protein JVT61DRAFT_9773 [Boletus reticuloceps]|uniref:C2 domain-containing protein n=1 Tax=Boletus reticuloceps TaxID=495285 RepID=A0A8I3A4J9_9AGAM|nr:hypothetical protein JVT61DRAFT_9773 [Boletus reticuloceps]
MGKDKDIVISNIQVKEPALGLRRLPAGFYTVVHHSGHKWRTENKRSSASDDVVEWHALIPLPSDRSATIGLEVYASFEFQPMLGTGEHLRTLTITVDQLLDCSAKHIPFTLFPKNGDIVSPCSSILVTVEQRNGENSDSSASRVFCSITETLNELEDATDHGHSALSRYRKHGEKRDLERSVAEFELALNNCPVDHPCRAAAQSNLAMVKVILYQVEDRSASLEIPIRLYRDALAARPVGHSDRPSTLVQLAAVHLARFEKQRDDVDGARVKTLLHEAMELSSTDSDENRAVSLMLQLYAGHRSGPDHASDQSSVDSHSSSRLTDEDPGILSVQLLKRFQRHGDLADLQRAIALLQQLVRSVSVWEDGDRFRASRNWILCARRMRHPSLLRAHSIAINLLPQLAWIGLSLTHRYAELKRGADVGEAAAAALDSGFPELAVEWLEQGRSIVWGELLQLRGSYEQLSSAHPDHARRLRELSAALDDAGATREKPLSTFSESTDDVMHHAIQTLQQVADAHRTLAIERDKLLQEIRRLPGFNRFLLQKDFSQLRASAQYGPVVVLNAAKRRCDALIVLADVDHVIHVPLPNFTFQRSTDLQGILKSFLRHALVERTGQIERWDRGTWESFLSPLWKSVVEPVMDALAFSMPGEPSRIFWCPTGPFVFLPIHAAGLYDAKYSAPGHKVFDFVVSSYVPTLSILAPSRNTHAAHNDDFRLLAVRQPPTDGQLSRLPGVHTELEHIKEHAPPSWNPLSELSRKSLS